MHGPQQHLVARAEIARQTADGMRTKISYHVCGRSISSAVGMGVLSLSR